MNLRDNDIGYISESVECAEGRVKTSVANDVTYYYPSHKYPLKLYENAPPYTPFHFEPKDNQGTWCVFALLTLISLPTNSEVLSDLFLVLG